MADKGRFGASFQAKRKIKGLPKILILPTRGHARNEQTLEQKEGCF